MGKTAKGEQFFDEALKDYNKRREQNKPNPITFCDENGDYEITLWDAEAYNLPKSLKTIGVIVDGIDVEGFDFLISKDRIPALIHFLSKILLNQS